MNAMKPYQQHLSPRLPSSQRLIYKSKIAVEAAGINDSSQSDNTDGILRSRMFKLQRVIPNRKILKSSCSFFFMLVNDATGFRPSRDY